jgi:hypothetical protein
VDKEPSSGKFWRFWKWSKIISPIALLVVAGAFLISLLVGKFFNFVGSAFPELNIAYGVLQANYPNQNNLGVNVNIFDSGNGTSTRTVTISIINPTSTNTDYMMSMGQLVCNALRDNEFGSDTLTIEPVTEINVIFFHYSSSPGGPSGDCNWWMNPSANPATTTEAIVPLNLSSTNPSVTSIAATTSLQSFQGTNATYAECKDGSRDFGTVASDTCIGHGGFVRWYW